jgi:hypothetical protein
MLGYLGASSNSDLFRNATPRLARARNRAMPRRMTSLVVLRKIDVLPRTDSPRKWCLSVSSKSPLDWNQTNAPSFFDRGRTHGAVAFGHSVLHVVAGPSCRYSHNSRPSQQRAVRSAREPFMVRQFVRLRSVSAVHRRVGSILGAMTIVSPPETIRHFALWGRRRAALEFDVTHRSRRQRRHRVPLRGSSATR